MTSLVIRPTQGAALKLRSTWWESRQGAKVNLIQISEPTYNELSLNYESKMWYKGLDTLKTKRL